VRVLTNKSSGKQGYAVAQAALDAGADVTLVSAPTAILSPVGAHFIPVTTAQEMLEAVLAHIDGWMRWSWLRQWPISIPGWRQNIN